MKSVPELIAKKRDGGRLTDDEIRSLIAGYSRDEVPNYQLAAMAMAVYFQGLDAAETRAWTDAMMRSGRVLDLSSLGSPRIDKHSTGGVGDKISLPLAPAVAACGVTVPMVAGRGLGHTGGTIDKLEAIPGYDVSLSVERFTEVLAQNRASIIGQTEDIAPADKRLYALRDVTATVESIPLITASIMSKKLAEGIEGLVLDVKVGPGAFMKTIEDARKLAQNMVDVGSEMGKRVVAFLTRMDAPLGRMVGNSCEVIESIDCLRGGGPDDVRELVVTLGGAMVEIGLGTSYEEGRERIAAALDDGTALGVFESMVVAQSGRLDELPRWTAEMPVAASESGVVTAIDGREVGLVGVALGAGRSKQGDSIDPVVGIRMEADVGDRVERGQTLATILHRADTPPSAAAGERLVQAFAVGDGPVGPRPLIIERIG